MFDVSKLSAEGLATILLLLLCSVVMLAVVIERVYVWRRLVVDPLWMTAQLSHLLAHKALPQAIAFCRHYPYCLARVCETGLARAHLDSEAIETAMTNSLGEQRLALERNLGILGTIAVVAPFIGLFGTVVGIMRTFHDVAAAGQAGVAVVAAGVAEALVATAVGLFVAITAVVFFNYFKSRITNAMTRMAVAATRLSEMIELARTGQPFPEDLVALARQYPPVVPLAAPGAWPGQAAPSPRPHTG